MTKPNPKNCKNCSSKCAYDCAQFQYTIQNSSDNLPSCLQTNIIAQMLSIRGEEAQLSSKFISKFQSSKSDDITCAATFAQGSANRVRSLTFTVSPARFHAFALGMYRISGSGSGLPDIRPFFSIRFRLRFRPNGTKYRISQPDSARSFLAVSSPS